VAIRIVRDDTQSFVYWRANCIILENSGDPMQNDIYLKGWVERDGRRLSREEIAASLSEGPGAAGAFGGEFLLRWNDCRARDALGVIAGDCPAGAILCGDVEAGRVDPPVPPMKLAAAIEEAVRLRSDEGVVALSGGVDSALVAALAGRECVAVGLEGSHDLRRAALVAAELGLSLETVTIPPAAVEDALRRVLGVIPRITPVDAAIAATLYFVAQWAGDHGIERILAGQGADELFGGYARYLETETLARDLEEDFRLLAVQGARDQAVASLHGAYFSLPYLDLRVVRAARAIPAGEKIAGGVRKRPLRMVAEQYIPADVARYEKKAMQYGSGVWRVIQRLARQNGYKKSVQGYLIHISRAEEW
jgi:asparagine synthase (glutamine-hydrolysing)